LDLDPDFAEARGEWAKWLALRNRRMGGSTHEAWALVRSEAQRALEQRDDIFPAWIALALHERDYRGDLAASEKMIRRAMRLRPRDASGPYVLSHGLSLEGRHGEAVQSAHDAVRLEPTVALYRSNVGARLAHAGRMEDAIEAYRIANRLHPTFFISHEELGFLLLRLGRLDEAMPVLERAWMLSDFSAAEVRMRREILSERGPEGFFSFLADLRIGLHRAGRDINLAHVARLLIYAGRLDEAIEWAEQAHSNRQSVLAVLQDPIRPELSGMPRYQSLRVRVTTPRD
jgi:tetratricopeptide (TPR) repeat protein